MRRKVNAGDFHLLALDDLVHLGNVDAVTVSAEIELEYFNFVCSCFEENVAVVAGRGKSALRHGVPVFGGNLYRSVGAVDSPPAWWPRENLTVLNGADTVALDFFRPLLSEKGYIELIFTRRFAVDLGSGRFYWFIFAVYSFTACFTSGMRM